MTDGRVLGGLLVLYPPEWLLGDSRTQPCIAELLGRLAGGDEPLSTWLAAESARLLNCGDDLVEQLPSLAKQVATLLAVGVGSSVAASGGGCTAAAVADTLHPCLDALSTAHTRPYQPAGRLAGASTLLQCVLDAAAAGPAGSPLRAAVVERLLQEAPAGGTAAAGLADHLCFELGRLLTDSSADPASTDAVARCSSLVVGCLQLCSNALLPEPLAALASRVAGTVTAGLLLQPADGIRAVAANTRAINSLAGLAGLLAGGPHTTAAVCSVDGGAAVLLRVALTLQLDTAEPGLDTHLPSALSRRATFGQLQWTCATELVRKVLLAIGDTASRLHNTLLPAPSGANNKLFSRGAPM